jgi:N,N'-diacetyllegionaminate synthase
MKKESEACELIAEVGVNHNGSQRNAIALIDAAQKAGVNTVKFQVFSAKKLVAHDAPVAEYQAKNVPGATTQTNLLKSLELSWENIKALKRHCDCLGVEFLATAFDEDALTKLVNLGMKRIKIPSGEITNRRFLEHAGGFGLPIILSTGMSTLDEVNNAVSALILAGGVEKNLTLLHCTSLYPASAEDLNLRAIETLKSYFGLKVGYSDHSQGKIAALGAVSLGAVCIEKHITLDNNMPGPDHLASLSVADLDEFVLCIRELERGLGSPIKCPVANELPIQLVARRSIVASTKIKKGDLFSEKNLTAKRPGGGISPMRMPEIIGLTAQRSYDVDEKVEI